MATASQIKRASITVRRNVEKNLSYLSLAEHCRWYGRNSKAEEYESKAYAATKRAEQALYKLDLSSARESYQLSGVESNYTCCDFSEFVDIEKFIR